PRSSGRWQSSREEDLRGGETLDVRLDRNIPAVRADGDSCWERARIRPPGLVVGVAAARHLTDRAWVSGPSTPSGSCSSISPVASRAQFFSHAQTAVAQPRRRPPFGTSVSFGNPSSAAHLVTVVVQPVGPAGAEHLLEVLVEDEAGGP